MKSLNHIREKAIKLRYDGYSLPDICNMLGRSKGTVHYWVKDIPLQRNKIEPNIQKMLIGSKNKWKRLRDSAYKDGLEIYQQMKDEKTFRDFIIIYLTEGFRKTKNVVQVVNSNPMIIKNCKYILEKFSDKIQYIIVSYKDKDEIKVREYWANKLNIDKNIITYYVKENGNLKGRNYSSLYGTMRIQVNDYRLRAKMQSWMDMIEDEWKNII